MSEVIIREFKISDLDDLCNLFDEVTSTGDTYDFAPNTPREVSKVYFTAKDIKCFVAECAGKIAGMYILKANRPGNASHIGNCSYMVSSEFRRNGIGELLCRHSIEQAKKDGFKAIQFNFVVSTNNTAVKLWQKCGFEIIGTIPDGYNHAKLGFVDAYIMFRKL
jgi:ribosomal protein S18 acetylase RimI-like enzyme